MISLINVYKTYNKGKKDELEALKNISLELPDTGMIALCGKSGSGKTTLLNAIGGLIGIDSGQIIFDGECVENGKKEDYIHNIGYIFQNNYLNNSRLVIDNVADALRIEGVTDEEEISTLSLEALRCVGLESFFNRSPQNLSGGQQQRVAVARAIVKKPKIVLADEPTGNLDEKNKNIVMTILQKISRTCLVIVVTHDMDIVNRYCESFVKVSDGLISELIMNPCFTKNHEDVSFNIDIYENEKKSFEVKQKKGQLFNWNYSICRGVKQIFGNSAGHKILGWCLVILSFAFVLMSAISGKSIRRWLEADIYNKHLFAGYVSDGEMAHKLETVVNSKQYGIDSIIYNEDIYSFNQRIPYELVEYENSLIKNDLDSVPTYWFTGTILPLRMMSDIIHHHSNVDLQNGEAIMTSAMAKQLTNGSIASYFSEPEMLIGIEIGNSKKYKIVEIVDSEEDILFVNDSVYADERYCKEYGNVNIYIDDQISTPGKVIIKRNMATTDKSVNVSDKILMNGVELEVLDVLDVYYPYEQWLFEYKSKTKDTYDQFCSQNEKSIYEYWDYYCDEYSEYLRYCGENRDKIFFDHCMELAFNGDALAELWLKADLIGNYDYYYAKMFYMDNSRYPLESEFYECYQKYPDIFMQLDEDSDGALSKRNKNISYYMAEEDYYRCSNSFGSTDGYALETIRNPRAYVCIHTNNIKETDEFVKSFFYEYDRDGFSYLSSLEQIEKDRSSILKEELFTFVLWGTMAVAVLFVLYLLNSSLLIARGKEYAIYRCIGVSKNNIIFNFCIETIAMITTTSGICAFLSGMIIWLLNHGKYAVVFEKALYYPLPLVFGISILFLLFGLLVSFISIKFFLRKDPGDLLLSQEV